MATVEVNNRVGAPAQGRGDADGNDLTLTIGTAPDLLLHLGLCIAISSSQEISKVRLPSNAPAGPGLSTNLIQVANEGSNAFLGAYKDLLSISTACEELSRENGRGATKSSTNMVYRWVMDCVADCERSGSHTESNFDHWKETVQAVQKAVHEAKDMNAQNLDATKRDQIVAMNSVVVNQTRISSAMDQVGLALLKQEERRKVYKDRTSAHESRVAEQLNEYMVNPFLAAIKRPFKWAAGSGALQDAANLRYEAERHLDAAAREVSEGRKQEQEFRLQSQRLLAQISDYEYKAMRMNEVGNTISEVCILLVALGNDVTNLLATFASITSEIERIVRTRRDLEEPAGINLGFTQFNPFKKKGSLKTYNKKDKALMDMVFLDRIRQMKEVCLGIHVTANLYASIINDVINYGFSEAIRFSYDTLGESSPSEIIAQRRKAMAKWHREARHICAEKNREAKQTLERKMLEMETGRGPAFGPGFGRGFAQPRNQNTPTTRPSDESSFWDD